MCPSTLVFQYSNIPTLFIALGSNINAEKNLKQAAVMLREVFPGIRFSSVFSTAARDVEDQPDYLNAVGTWNAEGGTSPGNVLKILQGIEKSLGKAPPYRYGPRTIDLDILLYNNSIIPSQEAWLESYKLQATSYKLIVPHPRMEERRFVLEPLCELIDPEVVHPVIGKTFPDLLSMVQEQRCERVECPL